MALHAALSLFERMENRCNDLFCAVFWYGVLPPSHIYTNEVTQHQLYFQLGPNRPAMLLAHFRSMATLAVLYTRLRQQIRRQLADRSLFTYMAMAAQWI